MTENKNLDILDYLVLIVKWKRFLILLCFFSAIVIYLSIFFFVEEKFDAYATIIPIQENNSLSGISGILKNLPIDISGNEFSNTEMTTYNTIIYSRTNLQQVIQKFDLIKVYNLDTTNIEYKELALEKLSGNITAKETENNAYEIKVRASSPQLSAEITNYIIKLLNNRIIELKIKKSSENREFLENRLAEVRKNLKASEDSLMYYQQKSGMLSAEDQVKGIMEAYSTLETQLITKQIEKSIMEKLKGKDSPTVNSIEVEVQEFEKKMKDLKKDGQSGSILLSLNSLPKKTLRYLRLYRNVEINNSILEFVLPLYEQARFEEQKDIPVLQVIDYAVPPAKKSFPPRMIFTILITFGIFIMAVILIIIKENKSFNDSGKVRYIKKNLFKWKISD